MKYAPLLVINALLVSLLFSCKKDGNKEQPPPPPEKPKLFITAVSPDPAICGDTVTVTGKYFGTDTSKLVLTLNNARFPMLSLSDEKVTFVVPRDYIKSGKQAVSVALRAGDTDVDGKLFNIAWLETKGWYYAANTPALAGDTFPKAGRIIFVTDSIGFLQREERVFRTDDGGSTWANVTGYNSSSDGYAFAYFDGMNVWVDLGPYVYATKDGGKSWKNSATGFEFNPIGLFMSSPENGLIVTGGGKMYKVKGGLADKANVTLAYTSLYNSIADPYGHRWNQFSALDESNLMITGRTLMSDKKYQLTISHKVGDDFNEYNIGYLTTATYAKMVQLVAQNAAYLIDANNDILKFKGSLNWVKLNQKATTLYFIDANTGYAAYDGKIIKTTDGGTTWKDEFSLKAGERIFSLFAKNGKIWAAGIDATQQSIVIKFNP